MISCFPKMPLGTTGRGSGIADSDGAVTDRSTTDADADDVAVAAAVDDVAVVAAADVVVVAPAVAVVVSDFFIFLI